MFSTSKRDSVADVAVALPHRLQAPKVTFPQPHEQYPRLGNLNISGPLQPVPARAFPQTALAALESSAERLQVAFPVPQTPVRSTTPRPARPPRRVYSAVTTSNLPCSSDLHRSTSPSSTSDSGNSTISSSRASLQSETILTPGRRPSDDDAPLFTLHRVSSDPKMTSSGFSTTPPQSIICTTDDEMPRQTVWWSSSPSLAAGRHHVPLPFVAHESKDGFPFPPHHQLVSSAPESSSRSMSPSSFYSHTDSSPAAPSSSDHSYHLELSKPSIRVTESPRGVPILSFVHGESLLGPPVPFISRSDTPSADDSASTVTGHEGRTLDDSPSPISRKRRLAALRNLVSNREFAQPWSVIERPVQGDDDFFWPCSEHSPPPQLNRLSLGSSFDAEDVSILAGESVVSLPPIDSIDKRNLGTWPRSRRYSRSMGALVDSLGREPAKLSKSSRRSIIAPERPIIPPRTSSANHTPTDVVTDKKPHLRLNVIEGPRPSSLHRNGSALRKSTSQRPMGTPRELPRPRQRKESFGVVYSGYSKSLRPTTPRPRDHPVSWRQSLSNAHIYDTVAGGPDGSMEIKRQEIMWEMSETEAAFVRSCRDVIRLFAAPLREAQGDWMKGLPAGVCELFESLEAIHKTHAEISTAQQIARRRSDVVDTVAFIEQFGAWVTRLAIHERYIMLFNTVVAQIEEAARDQTSIFGEFLRLQTRDKALGSLSLGSMLLKPVQRITKYTLFLRRLLAAIPATHNAHTPLVELIDSTESIIGRLEACKAREDDFLQLISLEERLEDLPGNFDLAIRGRRLLAHAQVIRVNRDSQSSGGMPRSVSVRSLKATLSAVPSFSSIRLPQPSPSSSSPRPGSSRGGSTDSELPLHRPRGLTTSPSSGTTSVASMAGTTSPGRQERSLSRSTSCSSSLAENGRPNIKMNWSGKTRRDEVLTLLVFNDMVAFAAPVPDKNIFKSRKSGAARLRILSVYDGGFGSVEDLRELEGVRSSSRSFGLTVRSPDGHISTSAYSMAPLMSRRAAALAGPGIEKFDQLVEAIQMTRSSGNKEEV